MENSIIAISISDFDYEISYNSLRKFEIEL